MLYFMVMSECPDGSFGLDCARTCGNCKDNGICNKQDGVCPAGCTPGYYKGKCVLACGHCKAGSFCDDVSGVCPDGCSAGFEGTLCNQGRKSVIT